MTTTTAPTTISEAADSWLIHIEKRKRKPAKLSSIFTFKSHLRAHILPAIGTLNLAAFGNREMRDFVAYLAAKKLSPATIHQVSNTVKQIIASPVDSQTGDALYPRTWNADFLDCPEIGKQSQPTVTASQIEEAISKASEADGVLYTLLAASGLRIGEALSLRIDPSKSASHFDGTVQAVTVRTSVWRRREQAPKTVSAVRTIELARPVADRVSSFVRNRSGFVFGNGIPASESSFRDRLNKVLPDVGFHAFRRWRTTWLRKNRVQEDIIKFWLGHADKTVTDGYSKLSEDVEYRREIAEKVGTGFAL
jgi:integrase